MNRVSTRWRVFGCAEGARGLGDFVETRFIASTHATMTREDGSSARDVRSSRVVNAQNQITMIVVCIQV